MTATVPPTTADQAAEPATVTARDLYLDLLQKVLVNSIYQDPGMLYPDGPTREAIAAHREVVQYDPKRRANGFDFPTVAHTMIGTRRMDNIRECVETVLADNIPGDLAETGVWRGGAVIYMRGDSQGPWSYRPVSVGVRLVPRATPGGRRVLSR